MNKHTSLKKVLSMMALFVVVLPATVSAISLQNIIQNLSMTLLSPFINILLTAALVVFFWGMVKYIYSLGEKEKTEGRMLMVWGVIALFAMVSVWGLVRVVQETLNITDLEPIDSIVIPGGGGSY
jgi:hypothetical protein